MSWRTRLREMRNPKKTATLAAFLGSTPVQVYFWLDLRARDGHRATVPSLERAAITGWAGLRNVQEFGRYSTEARESPAGYKLHQMRPMAALLPMID
ncbi:hypothetical protein BH23GEM5_BH23GEM5_13270 [soil metagenome]